LSNGIGGDGLTLLAASCIGTCCAFVAGAFMGTLPTLRVSRANRSRRGTPARLWLQQAGVGLSPARFWAACAGAGLCAFGVLVAVTGSVFVALVPAGALALMPRAYFGRRRRLRLREVQAAWPDGLRDLGASIAAGRSLTQAVSALAAHGPLPLRTAFARFPELARVLGTSAALEVIQQELADPTIDRVIEVLLLAHERGGAIVRVILEDLTHAIARDLKLQDALETESLEMRINARSVVVLPWFVLVALTARPGPFRAFYQSGGGVVTCVIAVVLSAIGVLVLGRLGHEPDEARVLGPGGAQ
jgi:tight adherence protein B